MMENRYCVIMCGGVGSRFWPFSKSSAPKQFIDFFGTGRSLLQMSFDRVAELVPVRNILAITNERYAPLVKQQLPDLADDQILLEPDRRNTAPCIAWAAYHIRAINPNAMMLVTPSDHLILKEDAFRDCVVKGFDFLSRQRRGLLTLGIKPNRPETGYGYIQISKDEVEDGITKVKTFTEKPNEELAKVFVQSGEFFWNSGIFLWSADAIIDAFHDHCPDIAMRFDNGLGKFGTAKETEFIGSEFPACPNISIDYAVMEKSKDIFTLPAEFGWSDLGSWGSLRTLLPQDENGNAKVGKDIRLYECKNCVVHAADESKVVVQGLNGYIIAEKHGQLLVCELKEEQRIKEFGK